MKKLEENILLSSVGFLILLSLTSFGYALDLSSYKSYLLSKGMIFFLWAFTIIGLLIIDTRRSKELKLTKTD